MRVYFSVGLVLLLLACVEQKQQADTMPANAEQLNSEYEYCPERPPGMEGQIMCTAQYDPVCGSTASGEQTFSNACRACATDGVGSYKKGACE